MEVETWNNVLKESKMSENLMYYRVGPPLPHHFKPSLSEVRIVQDFDSTQFTWHCAQNAPWLLLAKQYWSKKGFVNITNFPSITKPLTNGT
jgi:hypothetical protein